VPPVAIGRLFVTLDPLLGQPPTVTLAPPVSIGRARTEGGETDETDTAPTHPPWGNSVALRIAAALEFSPLSHYMGRSP